MNELDEDFIHQIMDRYFKMMVAYDQNVIEIDVLYDRIKVDVAMINNLHQQNSMTTLTYDKSLKLISKFEDLYEKILNHKLANDGEKLVKEMIKDSLSNK